MQKWIYRAGIVFILLSGTPSLKDSVTSKVFAVIGGLAFGCFIANRIIDRMGAARVTTTDGEGG